MFITSERPTFFSIPNFVQALSSCVSKHAVKEILTKCWSFKEDNNSLTQRNVISYPSHVRPSILTFRKRETHKFLTRSCLLTTRTLIHYYSMTGAPSGDDGFLNKSIFTAPGANWIHHHSLERLTIILRTRTKLDP